MKLSKDIKNKIDVLKENDEFSFLNEKGLETFKEKLIESNIHAEQVNNLDKNKFDGWWDEKVNYIQKIWVPVEKFRESKQNISLDDYKKFFAISQSLFDELIVQAD